MDEDEDEATPYTPEPAGPMLMALERLWTVGGDLALAAYQVISRGGLALPTQRALADESHMSTSAISRNSGGELPSLLAAAMAHARRRSWPRLFAEGEVRDARVWLAWLELARGHADVAPAIGDVAGTEREALAVHVRASDLPEDPVLLVALECLLAGLVARRCHPVDPIGYDDAVAVLARVVESLRRGADGGSGTEA